jgi:hypothetical protein
MHFFVWLLILLLIVLMTTIAVGAWYLATSKQPSLDDITFSSVPSSFEISPDHQLWTSNPNNMAALGKLDTLRTFLVFADWFLPTIVDLTSPYYFVLPEPATSIKTYLINHTGITFIANTNNLKGVLLTPTHVALKFAQDDQATNTFFTGANVHVEQAIGFAILYTTT